MQHDKSTVTYMCCMRLNTNFTPLNSVSWKVRSMIFKMIFSWFSFACRWYADMPQYKWGYLNDLHCSQIVRTSIGCGTRHSNIVYCKVAIASSILLQMVTSKQSDQYMYIRRRAVFRMKEGAHIVHWCRKCREWGGLFDHNAGILCRNAPSEEHLSSDDCKLSQSTLSNDRIFTYVHLENMSDPFLIRLEIPQNQILQLLEMQISCRPKSMMTTFSWWCP